MTISLSPRPLGRTGSAVTPVCAGAGPLGSVPQVFGYEVPADRATATVARVLAGPLNFIDTSASYSAGESERRIGAALRAAGGIPSGFVLATKVDPVDGDFSGPAVRRSFEGSLARLGVDRVPLLHLHDPEKITFEEGVGKGGPLEELIRIKEEGLAGSLGVAGGPVELLARYLRTGAFDALLTHNRWTLVDRSAGDLLDEAAGLGIGIINGAPFGAGILVKGTAHTDRYAYRPASPVVLERIRAMEAACARYGVPLAAAALQFSLRDPRICSTVVGMTRPERVDEAVRYAAWDIPDDLWTELEPLAAPEQEWLW